MRKTKLKEFFDPLKESIEFIQKHEPEEGYFLGFSGGKDSIVLKDIAIKSGVKFQSYYSATGIDPPELVKYIKQYHKDVIWLKPKNNFYDDIYKKGYPSRVSRWCCDTLKKNPSKNIILKHRLMGIRAEESWKRAKLERISKLGKFLIYRPLFYFKEYHIWDYIENNNLQYCKLYDEGFDRLGCIICPLICNNNKKLKIHKDRWPKQYAAFERAMSKLYQRRWWNEMKRRRCMCEEDFIQNWYNGK